MTTAHVQELQARLASGCQLERQRCVFVALVLLTYLHHAVVLFPGVRNRLWFHTILKSKVPYNGKEVRTLGEI